MTMAYVISALIVISGLVVSTIALEKGFQALMKTIRLSPMFIALAIVLGVLLYNYFT